MGLKEGFCGIDTEEWFRIEDEIFYDDINEDDGYPDIADDYEDYEKFPKIISFSKEKIKIYKVFRRKPRQN